MLKDKQTSDSSEEVYAADARACLHSDRLLARDPSWSKNTQSGRRTAEKKPEWGVTGLAMVD